MQQNKAGTYPFTIKSYESDYKGKMSLNAFFLFLQECAWQNAMENGFGYEFVEEENALWVLTRVLVQLEYFPKWKDQVEIKTWPRVAEGLFAMRDYQVIHSKKCIGSVSSSWLVLDKDSKRPRRISEFEFSKSNFVSEKAIDRLLEKIELPSRMLFCEKRRVYSSDIDVNGHVNNATYVRWIMDAHLNMETKYLKEFEINFIGELMLNDEFEIFQGQVGGESFYQIKSDKQKEICRARIQH